MINVKSNLSQNQTTKYFNSRTKMKITIMKESVSMKMMRSLHILIMMEPSGRRATQGNSDEIK